MLLRTPDAGQACQRLAGIPANADARYRGRQTALFNPICFPGAQQEMRRMRLEDTHAWLYDVQAIFNLSDQILLGRRAGGHDEIRHAREGAKPVILPAPITRALGLGGCSSVPVG